MHVELAVGKLMHMQHVLSYIPQVGGFYLDTVLVGLEQGMMQVQEGV